MKKRKKSHQMMTKENGYNSIGLKARMQKKAEDIPKVMEDNISKKITTKEKERKEREGKIPRKVEKSKTARKSGKTTEVRRKLELTVDSSSSDNNEENLSPTRSSGLVEEPSAPKVIQRKSISGLIETQPVLARFLDHLLTLEGGRRGLKPSKEAQWRVSRLLCEVDDTINNIRLLWTEEAMVHIRRTFIEGNGLLDKPRKVGTLRAYLTALLTFYNFILTRASTLSREFGISQEDCNLVNEFQGRVSNWMKSFTEESANRRTEVHREDFNLLLTNSQIWNLFNSPLHKEFEERFDKLENPESEFVDLRDYLMTMLLVQSAQRPGAVCNLTIDEFRAGEWEESTDVRQYVTLTKRHKTAGKGPASLSWDERTHKCAEIYLKKLRPTVANANSYLKRSNQKEMEPLFFLTTNGNHMHSSQMSNRLTKVAKLFDSSIKGTLTGKRIRKSAVSRHRQILDSGSSSGLSKEELARQMSHSTSTAEGHYAMRDQIKGRAKASRFLRHVATRTSEHSRNKISPMKLRSLMKSGAWKSTERTKISPRKTTLHDLRKKIQQPSRYIKTSPKKIWPKKKYYTIKEREALLQATSVLHGEKKIEPEMVYLCVKNDKQCQELKMIEKYTKTQLMLKVRKCVKKLKVHQKKTI